MTDAEILHVYLVPIGGDRHELYCETPVDEAVLTGGVGTRPSGWIRRQLDRFRALLAEADEWQRRRDRGHAEPTRGPWAFVMRKIAEAVAEQRLLWHIRRETAARLVHPDDLSPAAATDRARQLMLVDRDKHRRWCVIDGLLTIATTPIALLPGPNFFAYYFIFRTVGHFLSMRGAQQGLSRVTWTPVASVHLTEIRAALPLAKDSRARRIDEIARALGLDELGLFVDNVADR